MVWISETSSMTDPGSAPGVQVGDDAHRQEANEIGIMTHTRLSQANLMALVETLSPLPRAVLSVILPHDMHAVAADHVAEGGHPKVGGEQDGVEGEDDEPTPMRRRPSEERHERVVGGSRRSSAKYIE
jgi:hypothetical protein